MSIYYNPHLTHLASRLRTESTQSEIRLWKYLKGNQLGFRFTRQKPIGVYIVDFYCKELQIAIELDGLSHHHEDVMDKDVQKEDFLKDKGIEVLRFEDKQVRGDIDNVMAVIMDCIEKKTGKILF